jgi:hypothetical protein
MEALSQLFGWLTGSWNDQNAFGKALLGCDETFDIFIN